MKYLSGSDSNSADLSLVKQEFGEGEDEGISRFDQLLSNCFLWKNKNSKKCEFVEDEDEGFAQVQTIASKSILH